MRRSPLDCTPTTYGEAATFLGDRDRRKVGNNTYLERTHDEGIALVLHATPVVTFYATGLARFTTGGYRTVTTKERLNRVLRAHGFNVYAKDYAWRLTVPERFDSPLAGRDIDWYDGVTLCLEQS